MSDEQGPLTQAPAPARTRNKPPAPTLVWIRYRGGKQDHAAFLIHQTDEYVHVQWATTKKHQRISKMEVTMDDDTTLLDRRGRRKRSNNDVAAVPDKQATVETPAEQPPPAPKTCSGSSARTTPVTKQPVTESTNNRSKAPSATTSVTKTQRKTPGAKAQNKKAAPTSSEHDRGSVENGATYGSNNDEEKTEKPHKSNTRKRRSSPDNHDTGQIEMCARSLFTAFPVGIDDTEDGSRGKEPNLEPSVTFNGSVDPSIEGRNKRRRRRRLMDTDRRRLASGQEDEGEPQEGSDEFDFHEEPGASGRRGQNRDRSGPAAQTN